MKHVRMGLIWAARLAGVLLLGIALAGPATPARAEPDATIDYIVDNPTDVGGGACLAATDDDCSLRSAIQLANAGAAGPIYRIRFQSNYNINLSTPLPAIVQNFVDISAFDGAITRIVRVKGSGTATLLNGNVFQVFGNNTRIDSLRIYGSAAGWSNIFITGTAKNVTISNNLFGTPEPAACPAGGVIPAAYGGVYVGSTGAINVGAGEARAWIWGNNFRCFDTGNAIEVNGTNRVYIGSDNDGLANLSRRNLITGSKNGVVFSNGANFNFLRDASIQGNTTGVLITGNTINNFVTSSQIQLNTVGVQMESGASFNLVGTNSLGSPSDTNFIRSNSDSGVVISGATTHDNSVHGNTIGRFGPADPASNGNGQFGVKITDGAFKNYVGFSGGVLGSNIIGGNGNAGVGIIGGAKDNEIVGNTIGTAEVVDSPIPNLRGVYIFGATTTGNKVKTNLIARNTADGVAIDNARNNTIGDSNIIALNGRNGVWLQNGAQDNLVRSQTIYANGRHGIALSGAGTTGNQINLINTFLNIADGINETDSAAFNTWSQTTTEGNGGLGIDKDAGAETENNITPPMPVILSVTPIAGGVQVTGRASNSPSPTASNTVEVFGLRLDASGYGEGAYFFGLASVNMTTGEWSLTITSPQLASYPCLTAYQTFTPGGGTPPASSEFGPSSCRAMMPIVVR